MGKSVSGVGMRRVESSYLCDVFTGSAGGGLPGRGADLARTRG